MTGPDHYLNAESDLEHAANADSKGRPADAAYWMQAAQVHAALALAAATALGHYTSEDDFPQADRMAWYVAASEGPGEKRRQQEARAAERAEFAAEAQS